MTGPLGSPTMARQIAALLAARPGMRWVMHRTVAPALEAAGATVWPDFGRLDAVVTLGADPLGPGPAQIALTKGWSGARRSRGLRSHAFDSGPTLTAARADRRTALRPSALPDTAAALLVALQVGAEPGPVADAAGLLRAAGPGRAAVLDGGDLTPAAQATVARLNALLDVPIRYLRPFWDWPGITPGAMPDLIADMEGGRVPALILLGVNPIHDLDDRFAGALRRVPETLHVGTEADETAAACLWHGPLHHPLEDWSDLRAVNGAQALVQPLIAPLHDTRSAHEVLAMMSGPAPAAAHDILRATWAETWEAADFGARWRQSLHDGVIDGPSAEEIAPPAFAPPAFPRTPATTAASGFELTTRLSSSVLDGSLAANAWLQETPDPFTKQVWGNAAWLSPEDAQAQGLRDGDLVELASGRFNFFDYADKQAFENQGADLLQALRNPEVSVRARGVMEKCTYCVQRISAARRDAKKGRRPIADGEVVTACQSACPADAITFGDLADPASAVNRAKADARHYALLGRLGTRPRTTYLARCAPGRKEGA